MDERIVPTRIRLEASSACQLRCPSCPTTTGDTKDVVGKGVLSPENFEALLVANPGLREIELSNWGEIFVNPRIEEILEIAHRRGVELFCDNGANLNNVRDSALEAMVKYGLRRLMCSIDGVTQEVYAQYRVRGHVDTVIANVRRINELKRLHGSPYPALMWQFIVFGHNEHELPAARALAAELGMKFFPKLSWDSEHSPVHDEESVMEATGLPAVTRDGYRKKTGQPYLAGICKQLWLAPQINWDGKVLGCCRNFWQEFGGNAFVDGLEEVLNGEKISYARRMLLGAEPPREGIPCTTCELYLQRRDDRHWIRIQPVPATAKAAGA